MKQIIIILITCVAFLTPLMVSSQDNDDVLAEQYFQDKEYDKAADLYEKIFKKKPTYNIYSNYLICLLETKEYEKAEKMVKKQAKQFPTELRYMVDLGFIYQSEGDDRKKEKTYDDAVSSLTQNQQQVTDLANAFLIRREWDYAEKTYLQGRKVFKANYPFYLELAQVYAIKNDAASMIREYLDAIEFNGIYLESVQNLLQSFFQHDINGERRQQLKIQLLKRVQKNPDNTYLSKLLIWLAIQDKDFLSAFNQAKALDRKFKEDGERLMDIGQLAASNNDYEIAVKSYQYVITKGEECINYVSAKIKLANVMMQKIVTTPGYTKVELLELEKLYTTTLDELGISASTVFLVKDYAKLEAFYLDNPQKARTILENAMDISNVTPSTKALLKLDLADILLFQGEIWDASLLYMQVEKDPNFKSDPIGHEAKFRNAKLNYYSGEFRWAQAQLDVLKAATSKLIANDALDLSLQISDNIDIDSSTAALLIYSRADLLFYRNKFPEAIATLDSVYVQFPNHPILDNVLFLKSKILQRQGRMEEAVVVLQIIIDSYGFDILGDDALFNLAEIQEKFYKDNAKAMQLYEELLTKFPGSILTVEARKRFRTLRGDVLNFD
ncbi:MAG: tetratricopeptide repeat protein [Bacteroidota bacterium]